MGRSLLQEFISIFFLDMFSFFRFPACWSPNPPAQPRRSLRMQRRREREEQKRLEWFSPIEGPLSDTGLGAQQQPGNETQGRYPVRSLRSSLRSQESKENEEPGNFSTPIIKKSQAILIQRKKPKTCVSKSEPVVGRISTDSEIRSPFSRQKKQLPDSATTERCLTVVPQPTLSINSPFGSSPSPALVINWSGDSTPLASSSLPICQHLHRSPGVLEDDEDRRFFENSSFGRKRCSRCLTPELL